MKIEEVSLMEVELALKQKELTQVGELLSEEKEIRQREEETADKLRKNLVEMKLCKELEED